MRTTIMGLIGAAMLTVGTASANAAPVLPDPGLHGPGAIIEAAWGCGPYRHPVGGHWSWRGFWVPPHCAPNYVAGGPYWGWGWGWRAHWHPYWRWHHRHYW